MRPIFHFIVSLLMFTNISSAHAGFQLANGPFSVPDSLLGNKGGYGVYTLQYTNDSEFAQTVFGFELLDYTLTVTPYSYSWSSTSPALVNNIVDVITTSWTELGGEPAPLGSISWSSPLGLTIPAGGVTNIGTFDVTIPPGFRAEYFLTSTDPLGITISTAVGAISGEGVVLRNGLTTLGQPTTFFVIPHPNGKTLIFDL